MKVKETVSFVRDMAGTAASDAGRDPIKNLCEEATCSVCLEYFKDPVIIECGHNFCQACLTQCWDESGSPEISCPQCREKVLRRSLRPNWQLANMVEIAKELRSQKGEGKGKGCEKHQEPLKLFCKDHEYPICVVCDRSKEHENHKLIPLDEALEAYKGRIWNLLETLKNKREKILAYKADTAQESQGLLMEEVEKEISAKRETLSKELSLLESLIRKMEEKYRQPANEFLQDIGSFLQGHPKAKVTLDPETAHPRLILSEDRRTVTFGDKLQDLPDNPERFNLSPYVLGHEAFTGGRHFWEITVGSEEKWAIGVARKSVGRKGFIPYGPKGGIWRVGKWANAYRVSNPSRNSFLPQKEEPKRIRVTLNYEGSRVAFYNAETAALIFEYQEASFSGETILPFFSVVRKARLTLSS
ncbi:hypothetical protein JD844_013622 [Phrynosoma platyrhinos]|uniref:Zinc finger protein RFP-like n=1 Tax=Phrynosoma platyrhinos TaxID=52577 RepID=A0ABQ7TL28_PHRPL|nr:hypothetical protein JD844_013622 [Phrynosoma platyrhinos]